MDFQGIPHLEGRIEDLIQAGQLDANTIKIRRALATARVAAMTPLLPGTEGFAEDWLAQYHRSEATPAAPRVNCYTVRDLTINGMGYLHIGGKLILTPEVYPGYWRSAIANDGGQHLVRLAGLRQRRIKGQTLVCFGWGPDVYGHFLIEVMPRLLIARRSLGDALAHTKILLPSTAPAWVEGMTARVLGLPDPLFERYDPMGEQVVLSRGIVPGLAHQQQGFHPGQNALIDELRDSIAGTDQPTLAPRIFISRAIFSNPSTPLRLCQNELRLAEIAAREYGFAVIAPETLPWETQIKFLAGASVIAGAFGSGLHGAIFARPDTRIAVMGFLNLTQSMITALRGQRIAYMATPKPNALGRYAVDEWTFRRFMDAVLR